MGNNTTQSRIKIIYAGIFLALIAAALLCWASFQPLALEGVKEITLNIVHSDGTANTVQFSTTARYLAPALDGNIDYDAIQGEDALYLTAIDGEYADYTAGEHWMYDWNDTPAYFYIDAQPVFDGDVFNFYIIYDE